MGTVVANRVGFQGDPSVYTFRTTDPNAVAGAGIVYWKEVSAGQREMFARDGDGGGQIIQITSGSGLNSANGDFTDHDDTPGSITANRVQHGNAGGTALTDGEEVNILSTGEFLVGTTTVAISGVLLEVRTDQNSRTATNVNNQTAGTGAFAESIVQADACTGSIQAFSSSYTPAGGAEPDSVSIASANASNGIVIRTTSASSIKLKTNATTKVEILAAGGFRITGTTAQAFLELDNGVTAAVSASGEARLRYNDTTKAFESSVDGGAYAALTGVADDFWQVNAEASNPTVSADSPVSVTAPVLTDTVNATLKVIRYDASTEEIRSLGTRRIKAGALTLKPQVLWRAQTLPTGGDKDIGWKLYWREIPDGGAAPSTTWAGTNDGSKVLAEIVNIANDVVFHEDEDTVTLVTEGILLDREYEFGVSRVAPAGTNMPGDWAVRRFTLTLED